MAGTARRSYVVAKLPRARSQTHRRRTKAPHRNFCQNVYGLAHQRHGPIFRHTSRRNDSNTIRRRSVKLKYLTILGDKTTQRRHGVLDLRASTACLPQNWQRDFVFGGVQTNGHPRSGKKQFCRRTSDRQRVPLSTGRHSNAKRKIENGGSEIFGFAMRPTGRVGGRHGTDQCAAGVTEADRFLPGSQVVGNQAGC